MGALSPSAYDEAGAGPQDLPVSAARDRDRAAEPGVGDGHHLHPDGARLRLSGCRARLVQPSRAVVARLDHDGSGILRRGAGGCLGSSQQARGLQYEPGSSSSRARPSPACSPTTVLRSAWTAKGLGGITSSSSGYGAASNTEVYLRAYDSVSEARASIASLDFYNARRPHSSLDGTTPDQAYFTPLPLRLAA